MSEETYSDFLDFEIIAKQERDIEVESLKKTIEIFQNESIATCERYSQEITKTKEMIDQLKSQTENEISGYKSELKRLNTELDNKLSEIESLKKDLELKYDEINKKDKIISNYSSQILKIEQNLSSKEKQVEDLKLDLINARNKINNKEQICVNLDSKVQFNEKKSAFFQNLNSDQKKEVEKLQKLLEETKAVLSQTIIESSLDHSRLVSQIQELNQKVENVEKERNSIEFLLREQENKSNEKLVIQCTEKEKLETQLQELKSLYMESQAIVIQQNEKLSSLIELNTKQDLDLKLANNKSKLAIGDLLVINTTYRNTLASYNNSKLALLEQKEKQHKLAKSIFSNLVEILEITNIDLIKTEIKKTINLVSPYLSK